MANITKQEMAAIKSVEAQLRALYRKFEAREEISLTLANGSVQSKLSLALSALEEITAEEE